MYSRCSRGVIVETEFIVDRTPNSDLAGAPNIIATLRFTIIRRPPCR